VRAADAVAPEVVAAGDLPATGGVPPYAALVVFLIAGVMARILRVSRRP
jgi:hypothetical protein